MNIIDALFITLGMDTSDYEKKKEGVLKSLKTMSESSDKTTKTMAESGKKAAQAFSMLKIEVLGALAAFGVSTGLKDFITQNMNGQAALGRLSANLGVSTQRLEAWRLAAKEMGQSGEDAVGALQSVAKGVAEARITGHSNLTDASRRFGFAIDPNNNEQTLINISARMAQLKDRQQAIAIAEAAGVGNIANLLLQGPERLQAQLAHTMSLTGAATKESTEQAARLQAQWADLQERFQQVGERVFNRLEPVLARLGERLANWLDRIDWQAVINRIAAFLDKVNDVVKAMGGWKAVVEVLGGVLALKLLSPLFGLLSLFTRLLPAMAGITGGIGAMGIAAGVAAAAFGGWKLGEWISSNMSPELRQQVGRFVATLMALAGDKDAQRAINDEQNQAAGLKPGESLSDPVVIKRLSAKFRKENGGAPEGGSLLGSDIFGQYDPAKSRKFNGNNAALFSFLEQRYGLPAGTLQRKFEVESSSGKRLFSPAGALGPMQFLMGTAKQYGLNRDNVMDLDASSEAAARYLSDLHKQFGDWDKANAAYNWGPGNLQRALSMHGSNWLGFAPSETQAYVRAHQLAMKGSAQGSVDKSVSVTINGGVNVNAPKATNAREVVGGMRDALNANPLIGGSVLGVA